MNRRNFAAGASLIAIAACTSPQGNANAQAVFAQIQYLLPLVRAMAAGIAIAVPESAGIVTAIAPYLDQAGTAFQALSATMTVIQAQPIVQQVEGYLQAAVNTLANTVNGAPPGSKLASFAPMVTEAQAVLALVVAFANGVQVMPKAAARPMALPLLHR